MTSPRDRFEVALRTVREALACYFPPENAHNYPWPSLAALEEAFDAAAADAERTEDELRHQIRDLEEAADARELEVDGLNDEIGRLEEELDEAKGAVFELEEEALDVATSDPADPAWDLYFELGRRVS